MNKDEELPQPGIDLPRIEKTESSLVIERIKNELEAILDAISDPIFIHDKELKIVRANRSYCEAAGLSFNEVIGRPYFNVFPMMDSPFKMCLCLKCEELQEEIFIPHLDKFFRVKYFIVNDMNGSYRFSVHVMEDITEYRKSEERLKEEIEIEDALLNVATAISTTFNRDEMLRKVMEILRVVVDSERYVIFLWDKEQEAFVPNQSLGISPELMLKLQRLKLNAEIPAIDKLLKGDMVSIDDAMIGSLIPSEIVKTFGMKAVLSVPINIRGKVIGIIVVERLTSNIHFGRREEVLLDGISTQIAMALENIRLYKDITDKSNELSQRVETLKIMHEIDLNTLSISLESDLIETLVSLVSRLISADIIIIALTDYQRKGFIYKAGYGLPLAKDAFVSFSDTYASEVITTGRYKFVEDLMLENEILPFQKMLKENGYRSGIIFPLIAKGNIVGMFHVGSKKVGVFTADLISIMEGLSAQIAVALDNLRLVTDLEDLLISITRTLSNIIDAKSPWTAGHSDRVTKYALTIAGEMGLNEKDMKDLELAGLLHDIGKVGTYDTILDKPDKLNDEEIMKMKEHPGKGANILAPIKQLQGIIPFIKYHHEFYNGEGYPEGLKGREIPLMARILTVADTVDAMSADRPYRKGRSMDAIIEELKRCSGSQFDPDVVYSFMKSRKLTVS